MLETYWLLMELAAAEELEIWREIENWKFDVNAILDTDKYHGFLCWWLMQLRKENAKEVDILHEVTENF